MSVKVVIAEGFRVASGGVEEVETNGKTVRECLKEAVKAAPGLQKVWLTANGDPSKYIIITMNGENVPAKNVDQAVKDGDEIYPILLVGGG
jgi:molybdopterin converting factor small subunit